MILKQLLPKSLLFALALIFSVPSMAQSTCGVSPNDFTITASVLNHVLCAGGTDGNVTVNVVGGIGPFSYQWSGGPTTASYSNVATGVYSVTVYDNGQGGLACNTSVTVNEPTPIVATATVTGDVSCFGACDGYVTVTATGGVGPYTYLWTPLGWTGSSPNGLCAGIYTCDVTDSNGCTTQIQVTISEPAQVLVSANVVDASSCVATDGSISFLTSGGTAPYVFSIDGGITWQASNSFVNLSPGIYTLDVNDANGCLGSATRYRISIAR